MYCASKRVGEYIAVGYNIIVSPPFYIRTLTRPGQSNTQKSCECGVGTRLVNDNALPHTSWHSAGVATTEHIELQGAQTHRPLMSGSLVPSSQSQGPGHNQPCFPLPTAWPGEGHLSQWHTHCSPAQCMVRSRYMYVHVGHTTKDTINSRHYGTTTCMLMVHQVIMSES